MYTLSVPVFWIISTTRVVRSAKRDAVAPTPPLAAVCTAVPFDGPDIAPPISVAIASESASIVRGLRSSSILYSFAENPLRRIAVKVPTVRFEGKDTLENLGCLRIDSTAHRGSLAVKVAHSPAARPVTVILSVFPRAIACGNVAVAHVAPLSVVSS